MLACLIEEWQTEAKVPVSPDIIIIIVIIHISLFK